MYVYYIQYIYNLYNYSTYVYGIYNLHIMSDHPRGLDASQYPSCKGGPRVWNPWQTSGTGVPRGYHRVYRHGYRKKWPYVFFCLNLRSYGKSPFLNMVNQRWLAGKSLEVNNYAGYSCENHLFSWAMTSIANCWIARGYVLHQNWGMAPEVKKLSIPSQSTVAGGSCRGDQLWDTSRFFIIWNMPSGHTNMILLPPSLHGRSGFPDRW